ncbi:MAG: phospholipase D-like domain-containing protein [Actinomycetota bacterium]|nr:phospholipase D-like domain-containing protein [Actinomycetota bacterium]
MIDIRTLTDGGQAAIETAATVADFLEDARRSLDLAQYDFHLAPETAAVVGGAITKAATRGVAVRIAYNIDHRNPIPVPPPPEPDVQLIASLGVPSKGIAGVPDLMHHKYVVRDGDAVWTGSMNWTDDSFSRQENILVTVRSAEVAAAYTADFEQLWQTGIVEKSGFVEPRTIGLDRTPVRVWFTPGYGEDLSARIARAIGRAKRRVRIASPVITTGPVLGTLAQVVADDRVDIAGVVDQTQVRGVVYQWSENGNISWKLPLLRAALARGFTGKLSTPWQPEGSLHDFMHAKVTVADDIVFAGSFNLSRSGEMNAENVLEIESPELADRLAAYIDQIRVLYPDVVLEQTR